MKKKKQENVTFPRLSETDSSAVGFKGRERKHRRRRRHGEESCQQKFALRRSSPLRSPVSPPEATVAAGLDLSAQMAYHVASSRQKPEWCALKDMIKARQRSSPAMMMEEQGPAMLGFLLGPRLLPSEWREEERRGRREKKKKKYYSEPRSQGWGARCSPRFTTLLPAGNRGLSVSHLHISKCQFWLPSLSLWCSIITVFTNSQIRKALFFYYLFSALLLSTGVPDRALSVAAIWRNNRATWHESLAIRAESRKKP